VQSETESHTSPTQNDPSVNLLKKEKYIDFEEQKAARAFIGLALNIEQAIRVRADVRS
jgi:hypothetical protein